MATPHDALFKHTFSQPEHAASELQSVLPPALARAVDWSTLRLEPGTFVNDELRPRHSDLLFSAAVGEARVLLYVLFEHKSGDDPWIGLQLLEYVLELWKQHRRDCAGEPALPPVVPVVIHHDDREWRRGNDLRPLLGLDHLSEDVAAALERLGAHLGFVVHDLAAPSEPDLDTARHTALVAVTLWCLRRIRGGRDAVAAIAGCGAAMREVASAPHGAAALIAVLRYIMDQTDLEPDELAAVLRDAVGPETEELLMSTADRLLAKGRAEGEATGRAEGEAKGRAEGEAKGRTELLLRLLDRRFGPLDDATEARVRAAPVDVVERWSDRLLTAATLAEVLA